MANMIGGEVMNEKYEIVMKQVDKLKDVDYKKYDYEHLTDEVDNFLKKTAKKNKTY
jgi:hypothetical protein